MFSQHILPIIKWQSLNAYRKVGSAATWQQQSTRFPFGDSLVTALPEK
jgi:hypothetical protein